MIKATKSSSPTEKMGATSLPPIGVSFMYIETGSANSGHESVFVSFERTYTFEINNISFSYNRISILTNDSIKSMGRCKIQLLSSDKTWSTRLNIANNDRYSISSTQWKIVSLNFNIEK